MILFHGYFRSSAAWRCRIAFNLKGLSPDFVPVHLRKGEQKTEAFRALNPQGLVPTVETGSGAVLTQSLAILEWLEELHPEPAILPADPEVRAQARAFAAVIACDIHPLQNLRVLETLRQDFGFDKAQIAAWIARWLGDGLAACEALLAEGRRRGDFAFGDRPSVADICLIPQLFSADRFGVSLAAMPRLRVVRQACEALPAFVAAHPERQPDFEPA